MIVRAEKNRDYTVINNTILNDPRLSWRARGLAAYLLTKPNDWQIQREHLAKQGPDGIRVVRACLAELDAAGYLVRQRVRQPNGRIEWEIVLYELPRPAAQESAPSARSAPVVKPPSARLPSARSAPLVLEVAPSARSAPVVDVTLVSTELPSTEVTATENKPTYVGRSVVLEADVKIVSDTLAKHGIPLNPFTVEQYMDMVKDFGIHAVLQGIDIAGRKGKAAHLNFVKGCARNVALGEEEHKERARPRQKRKRRYFDEVAQEYREVEV